MLQERETSGLFRVGFGQEFSPFSDCLTEGRKYFTSAKFHLEGQGPGEFVLDYASTPLQEYVILKRNLFGKYSIDVESGDNDLLRGYGLLLLAIKTTDRSFSCQIEMGGIRFGSVIYDVVEGNAYFDWLTGGPSGNLTTAIGIQSKHAIDLKACFSK